MSTEETTINENEEFEELPVEESEEKSSEGTGVFDKIINEETKKYKLAGMYKDWFLDYASYVILERAVPHIIDGLKPVQRRILHAMKLQDDGRFNKVASIVGETMHYHPHGDMSIKDALVQLGQRDLLVECQGNWGNILTGDQAAAGRYIEARLSEFAKEVVFNDKTTEWTSSYDGRNREPVNLPIKFPILLAQGSEGIAVGLACKILPHNFNELIDASISYLKGEPFTLYPDFPTGGLADVTGYNKGIRGGKVRIRAEIQKINKNTLVISEIPFGTTTSDIIDSILKANEKGKIKIKKIDDNTAENAEIVITLYNDISPDKTIDALYACTACEISVSGNCCVIKDKRPQFISVDEILIYNTENTKELLKKELEIRLSELESEWHYSSLEKIFFEEKVYKILENNAKTWEMQLSDVMDGMLVYQQLLRSPITKDDINRLVEKPVRKISRFDVKAVNEKIKKIEESELIIKKNLADLTNFTIKYFSDLKKKFGAKFPRRTIIKPFENIEAVKVVANNAKLYANKAEGFIGLSQKKIDEAEYICDCSDIDDVIVFTKDGRYTVKKVNDKLFVDRNIIHIAVFDKADNRTIYNVIYKDGKGGTLYAKRFSVTGVSRDKWYNITKGKEGSSIMWFTANPNGEAESLRVYLRPKPKLKKLILEFDFATLAIKNRGSMGNIVTKNPVQKIMLKANGTSTIGGKQMWFDWDINRLNEDGRGELLGEFRGEEHILAICKDGTFYTNKLDLSSRFQGEVMKVVKLDTDKIYTAVYWDGELKCFYIKRFTFEISDNSVQNFISESKGSFLKEISQDKHPRIQISFGKEGKKEREPETIEAESFIGVKGVKAKGKRLSSYPIETILFLEPALEEISIDTFDLNDDLLDSDLPEKNNSKESYPPGTSIEIDLDSDDLTLF
jgi:topoisomerase IV subunit A